MSLSAFEVTSTQDQGYTSSNAATGFKTNQVLLQIPQAVTVVTRDLIDDIGNHDMSEVLQFAGAVPYFRGESVSIRGARSNITLTDGIPDALPYSDSVNVDTYTILRGPSSTLYLNTSIGGTVLVTSKKPLPYARYALTGKVDSEGLLRGEFDLTGPLGEIGNMKFSYRLVGVMQGGDTFLDHAKNDIFGIYPILQMVYNDTVVRFAVDYHDMDRWPNANNFLTPQGELYVGAGRDEGYYVPGTMENHEMTRFRLEILQKLSDNWDLKISGQDWSYWRLGTNVFGSGGINFNDQTITFTARANDRGDYFQTVLADVNGKYTLFGLPMETIFGTAYAKQSGEGWIRATSNFGRLTRPIANPQLDNVVPPRIGSKRGRSDPGDYPVVSPGSKNSNYRANAYVQQTVEVVPDRLTAVVGLTYSKIKNNNNRNNTTVWDENENLHRYGLVFNVTDDLVIYGMESTMFSPQNRLDVNGNQIGNQLGTGREIGVKTAFREGRLSSTLAFFDMELSNQATFGGVRPDGVSYYAPLGTTTQKGFDIDLAITPLPGLQLVGAYYNGTVEDQDGKPVSNTYDESLSFFARYDMQGGAWEGLSFGGGYSRVNGRLIAGGGVTPSPAMIEVEPGNNVNLFAAYRRGDHWQFRFNVQNVLDEAYAVGMQAAWLVDPSPPRTYSFSATYIF